MVISGIGRKEQYAEKFKNEQRLKKAKSTINPCCNQALHIQVKTQIDKV